MANSYKNIVITPNTGSTIGDPSIVFSGGDSNTNTDIVLRVYPTSNGTLSFEGDAGQLFSITNELTNTIFSVNDISGLPMIEVNTATQTISLGQYYGNVCIGNITSTIYELDVAGPVNASAYLINGVSSILQNNSTTRINVGYTLASYNAGIRTTGTLTPDPTLGNYQYYTNNGAHTLGAPSSDCAMNILITNGASAGTITFSGYSVGSYTGDSLTTTNSHKFLLNVVRINGVSTYMIKALQ